MGHRRTSPALVVGALTATLAASVGLGWFAAESMSGRNDGAPTVVQADPSEPPYEAGDPAPASVAPPPLPAAPDPPRSEPSSPPPAERPARVPNRPAEPGATAPATPAPASPPADSPAPPAAPAAPAPGTGAAPSTGPPELRPYQPPPAIGIAAEALPPEGRAWALITAARRVAPAGSQERADLDWLVSYARASAGPRAPAGRQATARRALRVNAWWYGRRGSPGERVIARDPDGVILTYKRGYGFTVNPVATIGRWRDLNQAWSPAQLAEAVLPMLVERSHGGAEWAALEYFDVPGEPAAVRPGVSAMAQARAVSLFSRAWSVTRDPRFSVAAERALRAFTVPVDAGGVLARVRDPGGGAPGPWYPERAYPGEDPWKGSALNGFMVTLIELRRAAQSLGQVDATTETTSTTATSDPSPRTGTDQAAARLARDVADRGARSLGRFLPEHDTGSWSLYGLLTPGKAWRSYLADLNYHCYHVSLLRSLSTLYPDAGFSSTADRWQGYVDSRSATCPPR
jgi:hypothetical protein